MKTILNLMTTVFLLVIPLVSEAKRIAYSPSIRGQPLIFHFNSMQLSQFSAVTWAQMQNALSIQSTYANHLENLSNRVCCGQWNLWVDGLGQWLHQDTEANEQFGYKDFTGGFTLGADKCCKNFLVGAAFSYTNTSLNWFESAGNSHMSSYYGGFYGGWNNGFAYVNASLLGAFTDYHTTRHVQVRRTKLHANSHHKGGEALVGVETGVMCKKLFRGTDLVPFVSFDYVYLAQQGYSEDDARTANLHVKNRDDQLLQSQGGLQFVHKFLCRNWIIAPNLSVSYINQTPLASRSYDVTVIRLDHEFTMDGWDFERNLGALAFSLNFLDCQGMSSFTLRYDGQYGGNYWTQTGSLTCNLRF